MRPVAIVGAGMIPFGRRDDDTLMDMLAYASLNALDDAGLGDKGVNAVYVANMGAGMLQHQMSVASALVDRLSLMPAAADAIENGPASGASAIKNGLLAVASGYYDLVLVVGGETGAGVPQRGFLPGVGPDAEHQRCGLDQRHAVVADGVLVRVVRGVAHALGQG